MGKCFLLFLFFSLAFSACVFIRVDDSIDLGGHYRYIQDYPQTIIYHTTEKYEGVGQEVAGPVIDSYAFDSRYIIARSTNEKFLNHTDTAKVSKQYWLIDKMQKTPNIRPMDSMIFYKRLRELNIRLQLDNNTENKNKLTNVAESPAHTIRTDIQFPHLTPSQ